MRQQTLSDDSYALQPSTSRIGISIPTSIYKQKESRLIIIHRDTLQIHISSYLQHFVEWGTTISLITAAITMICTACSLYKTTMSGQDVILIAVYSAFGALFVYLTIKAIYKHCKHYGKSIETLMADIEKECPNDTE